MIPTEQVGLLEYCPQVIAKLYTVTQGDASRSRVQHHTFKDSGFSGHADSETARFSEADGVRQRPRKPRLERRDDRHSCSLLQSYTPTNPHISVTTSVTESYQRSLSLTCVDGLRTWTRVLAADHSQAQTFNVTH